MSLDTELTPCARAIYKKIYINYLKTRIVSLFIYLNKQKKTTIAIKNAYCNNYCRLCRIYLTAYLFNNSTTIIQLLTKILVKRNNENIYNI